MTFGELITRTFFVYFELRGTRASDVTSLIIKMKRGAFSVNDCIFYKYFCKFYPLKHDSVKTIVVKS